MAESAPYARRGFKGGAKASIVPAGVSDVAVALTGSDLSTWAGVTANGPFMFVLDPDTSSEEVCEATTIAGNVISGITRALRGTSPVAHAPNCAIKHIASDRDFDEANRLVNALLGISGLAAGDLLYLLTATTFARLAKGTANQALLMNAGATAPAWGTSIVSLLTAQGDIPYASAANTPARLAKGAALQHLRMNAAGTAPEWATDPGVLASLEYTGGSGTYSLTSATLTAVDTTNLRLTFTAPASGNVMVILAGITNVVTVAGWINFGILEGAATIGAPRTVHYEATLLNDLAAMHAAFIKVTGLTPGSSHTYDFAWQCGGGSTAQLSKGAPNGISMIVEALP